MSNIAKWEHWIEKYEKKIAILTLVLEFRGSKFFKENLRFCLEWRNALKKKKDIYFYLDLFFLMQKHKIILKFKIDPTFLKIGTRIYLKWYTWKIIG